MLADRAPGRTGPRESLSHQILRRVLIPDADQDGAQALVLRPPVELREVQLLRSHTP